jgi:hypothetical protein
VSEIKLIFKSSISRRCWEISAENRDGNAGPWKPWKTKQRFPNVPTALGNRHAISHIPTARRLLSLSQFQNTKTRLRLRRTHDFGIYLPNKMQLLQAKIVNRIPVWKLKKEDRLKGQPIVGSL